MWKKLGLVGTIVALAVLTPNKSAQAQIGISPLVIEAQENNGQAQATINVINHTKSPFRARIYTESFTYEKEKGFNTIPQNADSLVPYLQFSPRELVVPAGVTRKVRLNVQIPAKLPDGEYRSVIFSENLEQQKSINPQGVSTSITTRIGVTVFIRKGEISPKLSITTADWNAAKSQILVNMNNSGKASTYSEVHWTLAQAGKTIKTGKVNETGIIANSDRTVNIQIPPKELQLQPGKYQLSGSLIWRAKANNNSLPFAVNLNIK
jgi:P pilus assembly chaperone PapD